MASSHPTGSKEQPQSQDSGDPSLLESHNLDTLKALTEKTTTKTGQAPKRRGPKPNAKPALTRRQELNRQAQRTHRERKEVYTKALENEVIRLKGLFSNLTREKNQLREENSYLKSLLRPEDILMQTTGGERNQTASRESSIGHILSMSSPGGHTTGSSTLYESSPALHPKGSYLSPPEQTSCGHNHYEHHAPSPLPIPLATAKAKLPHSFMDYDQLGVDFVLALEKPCMAHLELMLDRSQEQSDWLYGHTLMATCPPHPFKAHGKGTQSSTTGGPDEKPTQHELHHQKAPEHRHVPPQTSWKISNGDLSTLLDLSQRLDLNGEITPVMAWGIVLAHPQLGELGPEDFTSLMDELLGKVGCHGFGAVLEEWHVEDALDRIFSAKMDAMLDAEPRIELLEV